MKFPAVASLTAAVLLISAPAWAQNLKPSPYHSSSPDQYQGVSNPPNEPIETNDLSTPNPPAANPAAVTAARSIHADQSASWQTNPATGSVPVSSPSQFSSASQVSPTTQAPNQGMGVQPPHLVTRPAAQAYNPADDIVTTLTAGPNQLPAGTILKVTLDQQLSSATTEPGAAFSGRVIEPITKNGRIVIPVGSILAGRVTSVSSGRRITGGASIHLRPDEVFLPNGTRYYLHAEVYDVGMVNDVKTASEGDVVHVAHGKRTAAEAGLFGGGAAAAGFMAAGGPAALIAGGAAAGFIGARWLLQNREAVLPKNAEVIFGLTEPMNLVAFPTTASLSSH